MHDHEGAQRDRKETTRDRKETTRDNAWTRGGPTGPQETTRVGGVELVESGELAGSSYRGSMHVDSSFCVAAYAACFKCQLTGGVRFPVGAVNVY